MTKEKPTEPRLRFPGFTDAWKQRKLGEVLDERNESRSPSADVPLVSFTVENGVTPKTERYNREFLVRNDDKKYKFTQLDDIVYNPANLKFGAIARNKYGAAVFSPIYITYTVIPDASPIFIELVVTFADFIQRALRYQEGTVYERMAVKSSDLLRSEILLPTLPEQEAIGSFFSDLDQLITLHQRKLDDVKELKKALLQKMFPKGNGNDFPELRFPEFTDAWKQRKLGELATFAKGNGYSKKDLVAEGAPIILYGRLYTKYETIISEIDTFVSVEENKNSVVYSEGGEVLVPASGESSLDIARASVVAEKGIILGGDLNIVRLHSEIFPVYLAVTISNGKQQKDLSKRAQGKSVVHLHNSDLKEVDLNFPTLPEQEAIGSLFSDLDQLITLHQRQLDHLKLLKKALLQQMFI
ncbi:TPA: restriction endonuclease subunit S [Streptococcus suis]|nr:restriction endonuclease subunit S [Streptococcus suis]